MKTGDLSRRLICCVVAFSVFWSALYPSVVSAQSAGVLMPALPVDPVIEGYNPMSIRGIKIYPDQPLRFDLLVDKGSSTFEGEALRHDIERLSRLFLASLAVPQEDMWVNLSPDGRQRVMPEQFSRTEMGRILLEQDYLLKQAASAMTHPESSLGAAFWKELYRRLFVEYGSTDVSADTLNKVWIVPAEASVYSRDNSVFVTARQLEVLTDTDYRSGHGIPEDQQAAARIYTEVFRDIVLPVLRRDVNTSERFAPVRQVYDALILATWYKRHQGGGLLARGYVGQNKVRGIDEVPAALRQEVFERYLDSVRKGVYSYIREDESGDDGDTIARKYFSGGVAFMNMGPDSRVYREIATPPDMSMAVTGDIVMAPLLLETVDAAQNSGIWPSGKAVKGLALAMALSLSPVALVHGASFAPSADGQSTVVQLQEGESYGQAVERIRLAYKKQNPDAYKQSSFYGSLWGKNGVVQRLAGGANINQVNAFRPLVINAAIPENVLQDLTGKKTVTVSDVPVGDSSGSQGSAPVLDAPVGDGVASAGPEDPGVSFRPLDTEDEAIADTRTRMQKMGDWTQQHWTSLMARLSGFKNGLPQIDWSGFDWQARKTEGGILLALSLLGGLAWLRLRPGRTKTVSQPAASVPPRGQKQAPAASGSDLENMQRLVESLRTELENPVVGAAAPQTDLTEDSPMSLRGKIKTFILDDPRALPVFGIGFSALLWGAYVLAGLAAPLYVPAVLGGSAAWFFITGHQGSLVPAGTLYCGIFGCFTTGDRNNAGSIRKLGSFMSRMLQSLEDRGGQQAGLFAMFRSKDSKSILHGVKILKPKRGFFWRDGSPVFYPDLGPDMVGRFKKLLPADGQTRDAWGYPVLVGSAGHVRFATGGELVPDAAHPHASPEEIKKIYDFDVNGVLSAKEVPVLTIAGHNGDNDDAWVGSGASRRRLDVRQMRRFFPAATRKYYEQKVTARYLKSFISELLSPAHPRVNYGRVLELLKRHNYVVGGRVAENFSGVSESWRRNFPGYDEVFFDLLESALFSLPPGDSPAIPLEVSLYLNQGDWRGALRFAYYSQVADTGRLQESVLSSRDERLAASVFERAFEQSKAFVSRSSYRPQSGGRRLSDSWFEDEQSAYEGDAQDQRRILDLFEEYLVLSMRQEMREGTQAGQVFERWQQRWESMSDPETARRDFVREAARQFFTADRKTAVRNFSMDSEGTYGIFVQTSLRNNGITLYSSQQDVAIGLNRADKLFGYASDPRVLKTVGAGGERYTEALHLRDGEVADISFDEQGNLRLEVWTRERGVIPEEEIEARIYPTTEQVNGQKNSYYAPPPVEYSKRRDIVKEDVENMSAVLGQAQDGWDDAGSFNRRSAVNLARRLQEAYRQTGKARLLIVGYDNSLSIPELLLGQFKALIPGLEVESVDANRFIQNPDAYAVDKNTVAMIVSKSGATFPSNLSAKLLMKLGDPRNVFAMTARIDSVLNTVLGQGLRPEDAFTERVFLTGDFYPSEAPVLSEQLLFFNQISLLLRLARELGGLEGNPLGVSMEPARLEEFSSLIARGMGQVVQEVTGRDRNGRDVESDWGRDLKALGDKLGRSFIRPWVIGRWTDIFVWSVFYIAAPLAMVFKVVAGLTALAAGAITLPAFLVPNSILLGVLLAGMAAANTVLTKQVIPYIFTEMYSRHYGLPSNGRMGARKLLISAPDPLGKMQRNFFSRLFANGLATTSPAAIYAADSTADLVTRHASDIARGDIILNLTLEHSRNMGDMSIRQAVFPKTETVPMFNLARGRAVREDIVLSVPRGADQLEQQLIDGTLGQFGMMAAVKLVGVRSSMLASLGGRLWNPAHSWSRAGVHTTPTPTGVTTRAREILSARSADQVNEPQSVASLSVENAGAQEPAGAQDEAQAPGGIDFDARELYIHEEGGIAARVASGNVSGLIIQGIVPRVGVPVPLSPVAVSSIMR